MLGLWPSHPGPVQTGPGEARLLPRLFRKAPAATVLVRNGSRAFEPFSVRAPPGHAAGAELSFSYSDQSEARLDIRGVRGPDPDLGSRWPDPAPRGVVRGRHENIRDHGRHESIVIREPLPVVRGPPEQAGQDQTDEETAHEHGSRCGESPRRGILGIHGVRERKGPNIKASAPLAFAAVITPIFAPPGRGSAGGGAGGPKPPSRAPPPGPPGTRGPSPKNYIT